MNESYDDPLARIQAAKQVAQQAMAKHGKEEVCDPPMGIDTPQRPALPAWQDVLGDAEQLVRQKPAFPKYIKGTVLENDVPVWIAIFALRLLERDRATRGVPASDPDCFIGGAAGEATYAVAQVEAPSQHTDPSKWPSKADIDRAHGVPASGEPQENGRG